MDEELPIIGNSATALIEEQQACQIHPDSSYLQESPTIRVSDISIDEFHVGQIPRLGHNTPLKSIGMASGSWRAAGARRGCMAHG